MKPCKTWTSLTEDTNKRTASAWSWWTFYNLCLGNLLPDGTSIVQSQWSKLASVGVVLQSAAEPGQAYASLGGEMWSALAWPLSVTSLEGRVLYSFPCKPFQWIFVTNPLEWQVVPVVATREADRGIVMEKRGEPTPLLKHVLMNKNSLSPMDLLKCARLLDIAGVDENSSAYVLLGALGQHFEGGNVEFTDLIIKKYFEIDTSSQTMLKDPLVKAVFHDLDADDKGEFAEIQDAIVKEKLARRTGLGKFEHLRRKHRLDAAARPPKRRRRAAAAAPPLAEPPAPLPPAPAPAPPPPPPPPLADLPAEPAAPPILEPIAAPAPHARGPNVLPDAAEWVNVSCDLCDSLVGQYKFHPNPGCRDGESYYLRINLGPGTPWPTKSPNYRCLRTSSLTTPDDWLRDRKQCCS